MLVNYATIDHDRGIAYGGMSGAKQKLGEAQRVEILKPTPEMRIQSDERFTIVRSLVPFTLKMETRETVSSKINVVLV